MSISVIINTYNSEKTLKACLESVKSFDEIILCDMYSTDQTLEIAKAFDCKIIMHEPVGYVEPARNFAISHASNPWILIVDSDEMISSTLKDFLYDYIRKDDAADGLALATMNFFMGKFMHGYYPDYHYRLFKKDSIYWPPTIHSVPQIKGRKEKAPARKQYSIDHSMQGTTVSNFILKMDKYTTIELERRKQESYGQWKMLIKCFYRFIRMYLLKGGFRDGKAGLSYAILNSFYKFVTIAKIWELDEKEK